MMRTKFFLMMLAAIVMGSQVTLFAQEKKGAKSERRQFNKEQMLEIQCNQIIKGVWDVRQTADETVEDRAAGSGGL